MKNKKEFFAVLFSVLICVLVVFAGVYATTTVGNNVSVGGILSVSGSGTATEFSVLGTASVSEDLWASGSFQFAGGESTATLSYSRLGSNTTGHSLADAYDLLITGMLEIDGVVYFDSTAVFGDIASANYGLVVDSMLQVGHGASVAYSRFGSGATGHSLDAANDLLISADLEVDGTAYFDGAASVALDLSIEGGDFSVSGDATITGNDLIFGNGGTIVNTSADKLTITEAEVLFSAIASVTTDLWVDRIYGTLGAGYLSIGDAGTTGHSLAAEDDLLVTGKLEVDGTAYFDGAVSVSDASGLQLGGGISLTAGTASPSADCVVGSWYFRAGQTASASLYFCATTNEWDDISGF